MTNHFTEVSVPVLAVILEDAIENVHTNNAQKMVGKIPKLLSPTCMIFSLLTLPFQDIFLSLHSLFFSSQVMVHVYKKRKPIYTVPSIS